MEQERHAPMWALFEVAQRDTSKGSRSGALLQSTSPHRGSTGVQVRAGPPLLGGDDDRCELAGTALLLSMTCRARVRRCSPTITALSSARGNVAW